ncbi:hypothetical protein FGO68_gene6439 [Halteria grandinella]|uniref:Uncharacterized protein n=1 Tax=Halteria grandinella TaxID=5974 RepID=A0A8J8P8S4_HALGN|nr:hypothetical protein FGO68_gene6439 [Halteria grandinella]
MFKVLKLIKLLQRDFEVSFEYFKYGYLSKAIQLRLDGLKISFKFLIFKKIQDDAKKRSIWQKSSNPSNGSDSREYQGQSRPQRERDTRFIKGRLIEQLRQEDTQGLSREE